MTSRRWFTSSVNEGSFSSATTRWARLRHLSPAELTLGAQAIVVLPTMAFALKRWGLRRVQERLARTVRSRPPEATESGLDLEVARRVAWIVKVAARRGPWPANCLQRSVTLWWFLARRGVTADLRIGVRRRPGSGGQLDFHAWVECGGVVLNDSPGIRRRFATFDRAIAPRDASWRR